MKQFKETYRSKVAERLMRYVQVDTCADPNSDTQPSSMKQKDLSKILVEELKSIGLVDAELDEWGYVYATLPATAEGNHPVICFCDLCAGIAKLFWLLHLTNNLWHGKLPVD